MEIKDLLHKYCERLGTELEDEYYKIEKATISVGELEIIKMLLSSLQKVETILAMKEGGYSDNEYSGRSIRVPSVNYGYSGNNADYSDRNRNDMGRYSGHNDNSSMISQLEEKLRSARTEEDARSIRDAIDAISRLK